MTSADEFASIIAGKDEKIATLDRRLEYFIVRLTASNTMPRRTLSGR